MNAYARNGGRFVTRLGRGGACARAALALRGAVFRAGGPDRDSHDAGALHLTVTDRARRRTVLAARVLLHADGREAAAGYAGSFYGLEMLAASDRPVAEIGRFCMAPRQPCSPDALRGALATLTGLVLAHGVGTLIGCASLPGTDPDRLGPQLALLRARHCLPHGLRPAIRAASWVPLPARARGDALAAARALPPLLRLWLAMGARVSDHAVIDHDLGTTHVFVRLDPGWMAPRRRRSLMRLAAAAGGA